MEPTLTFYRIWEHHPPLKLKLYFCIFITQIKLFYESQSNHTPADSDLRDVFLVYIDFVYVSRHVGSYNMGKLRGLRHKGRISAAQSSYSKWTGQYKKCVQYDLKFTSIYTNTVGRNNAVTVQSTQLDRTVQRVCTVEF